MGCLGSHDEGQGHGCGDLQGAGGAVESQSAAKVGHGDFGAAVAHPAVVDLFSAVDAGAGEAEAEGAGHCGFGPAGVGGAVAACVAPHGTDGTAGAGVVQECCEHDPEHGEAGGRQVDDVVEPG